MKFHIITIFPEAFTSFVSTSIIKKALDKDLFEIELYKLWDFSDKNFKHVDDKAFGMHGQVISPEPLSKAIHHIINEITPLTGAKKEEKVADEGVKVIYMSPAWTLLTQETTETLSHTFSGKDIIVICGHYEWIDARIIEKYVDYEISIWEYVLTSWELSAQVFIDSLVRHIPDVIGNQQSIVEESFSPFFNRQKEHFVYTRPRIFEWMEVPSVLTSWNHKAIEDWKQSNLR